MYHDNILIIYYILLFQSIHSLFGYKPVHEIDVLLFYRHSIKALHVEPN